MDFEFDYEPGTIRYGPDSATDLDSVLTGIDAERALVVTGRTVGRTETVMDPVREGLGEYLVGEFAETTPAKDLRTAYDCAARAREADADALVAVGGGSSLDVAKVARALSADARDYPTLEADFHESGGVPVAGDGPALVAVPTTLAGADLSVAAGITAERDDGSGPGGRTFGGAFDERLMPDALVYDPELVATTPHDVLCASAMNGFDKGIETLYARNRTPVTDATAMRGLRLLSRGLPELGAGERDDETLRQAVVGTVLVQYGVSRSSGTTLSVLHAYGHGLSRGFDVQQGAAHGIVAPHALRDVFARVDGRRDLLAEGLGRDAPDADPETTAGVVVERVTEIRDALGLPDRLRSIPDMAESDLPTIAEAVVTDGFWPNRPPGYDPDAAAVEAVLREAW